mmetsp:Transcript_3146/g.7674  ORF Transcript_3146/g.7674 Transcript_3146/m.7674 type:complete len:269 (-) Transcript_3146:984-1790(-)
MQPNLLLHERQVHLVDGAGERLVHDGVFVQFILGQQEVVQHFGVGISQGVKKRHSHHAGRLHDIWETERHALRHAEQPQLLVYQAQLFHVDAHVAAVVLEGCGALVDVRKVAHEHGCEQVEWWLGLRQASAVFDEVVEVANDLVEVGEALLVRAKLLPCLLEPLDGDDLQGRHNAGGRGKILVDQLLLRNVNELLHHGHTHGAGRDAHNSGRHPALVVVPCADVCQVLRVLRGSAEHEAVGRHTPEQAHETESHRSCNLQQIHGQHHL